MNKMSYCWLICHSGLDPESRDKTGFPLTNCGNDGQADVVLYVDVNLMKDFDIRNKLERGES